MTHDYIAKMYKRGQDTDARRAIAAEIIRANTGEDDPPTYQPTPAEIETVEAEYYVSRRAHQYGPPEMQMEYVAEHGLAAWQTHVTQVKTAIPKPKPAAGE